MINSSSILSNPYAVRNFIIPSGFSFLPVNTDIYTDAVINNLYLRFSACYSNREYNLAKAAKMGCKKEMDSESKYLLMALYILRNWYNPNPYSFVMFSMNNITSDSHSTNSINLYIVPEYGSEVITSLLDTASGYNSTSGAYTDLINNAPLYLLGQNGWTLTFVAPDVFTLTPPSNYTGNSWIWVNEVTTGVVNTTANQWVQMKAINPCLSVATIQDIIETCIQICGNQNCTNINTLLDDDNFIPLGQSFIAPSDIVTNQFPNIYFE